MILPPETRETAPITDSEERKKELRRVYRKLKGVRTQLSAKVRELKKEIAETRYQEEGSTSDEQRNLEDSTEEDELSKGVGAEANPRPTRKAPHSMQFEVKALVDHKRRLRKRFWKLQEETRRSK